MYYNRSLLKKRGRNYILKKKWFKFFRMFQISLWTWSEEGTVRWLSLQASGPHLSIQIKSVRVIWDLEVKYCVNKRCITLGWRLIICVGGFDIECISGKIEPLHWAKALVWNENVSEWFWWRTRAQFSCRNWLEVCADNVL